MAVHYSGFSFFRGFLVSIEVLILNIKNGRVYICEFHTQLYILDLERLWVDFLSDRFEELPSSFLHRYKAILVLL
jgi:hypothetical protein